MVPPSCTQGYFQAVRAAVVSNRNLQQGSLCFHTAKLTLAKLPCKCFFFFFHFMAKILLFQLSYSFSLSMFHRLILGYRTHHSFICNLSIRSIWGYNHFIATCFVCLRCHTCFPKRANQDVWLRQTWYKVKSLLPTPNSVTTSPYPWEVSGSTWFPSVCFSRLITL